MHLICLYFAVWVDNDKKEKEITIGKSNTAEKEDLGYWNLADSRISNIGTLDQISGNKNKPVAPKYVGNEDTPSVGDRKKPKETAANRDTVDAEVINDEETEDDTDIPGDSHIDLNDQDDGDSRSISEDYSRDSYEEEDTENGGHGGANVADEATSIVDGVSQRISSDNGDFPDDNLSALNEVGQGKSRVEKPTGKKSKRKKSSHKKSRKRFSRMKNKIARDKFKPTSANNRNVKGYVKTIIQRHSEESKSKKSGRPDAEKAKKMLFDGIDVKRDDISRLEPLELDQETQRDKLDSYAPDDGDISDIVSRFTDQKHENSHRMGNDELQMHLDDEALKMQVKAIEEEDSNVKSVLQGSERFANEQKLGRFEGDFEKDLIKNIGKDGVDLGVGEFGKRRSHGERHEGKGFKDVEDKNEDEENEKEEENERKGDKEKFENKESEDENDDEGDDESSRSNDSRDKKWNSDGDDDDDKTEDRSGERKDTVRNSNGVKRSDSKSRGRAKKYNFFTPTGKFGGDISPTEEAEMGVNIDNQAMETEIKAIENEDAKVSSALQGLNKSPEKIELDEYSYDTPDGLDRVSSKFDHQKFSIDMTDSGDEDQADQKHDIGQTEDDKSKSHLSEELRDMLRETSKILNDTNAVLNEGHAIAQKSHEILNSTHHGNAANETNAMSNQISVRNETNGSQQNLTTGNENSTTGNASVNINALTGSSQSQGQYNGTSKTENNTQDGIANGNNTQDGIANRNRTSENLNNTTDKPANTSMENSAITSSEEFVVKGVPVTPAKRVLKRNDDVETKYVRVVRERGPKVSWKRHEKSHRHPRKHKLKSFFDENEVEQPKRGKKKYTKSEEKILNLMFKSPMFKSVRGKIGKFHLGQADKRSHTPSIKTTYRRFKTTKAARRKGLFTKKRITEVGKKRGSVEEGMTGGKYK